MDSNASVNDIILCIPEIENLNIRFSEFNPLKVLGVSEEEIRHSHIISWLLDPKANHGLGTSFLKIFLRTTICSSENQSIENVTNGLKELILGDFTDLQVHREHSHIDILCVSENNKIVILIENKYNSDEHSDQLNRYLSNIKAQYSNYICIPIFLSIEGLPPSHSEYLAASYKQVLDSIEQLIKVYSDRIPQAIKMFLDYYQIIISEKIMEDPDLQEIARKIYKENKAAIDFIYSIGNGIDLTIPGNEFIKNHENLKAIWPNPNWYSFVDKEFIVDNKNKFQWGNGNPVQYWFSPYQGKLKMCLEVGPFDSGKDRLSFLLELEKAGCKLRPSSKTESGTYTRLHSQTIDIKDWKDDSELEDKMKSLLENRDLKIIVEIVKSVIKKHSSFWNEL